VRGFSLFSWATRLPVWIVLTVALAAVPASGQDGEAAKQFVASVYEHYANHGKGIDFTGPKARSVFDSSLIALLHADQKAVGPNEVGVLDGNPICSCQDWDGIWDLKINVQMEPDGRAKAAVSFALFAPKAGSDQDHRSLEMTLMPQGGQWRIRDILDKSDLKAPFDLRAELEKEIRTAKRDSKAQDSR
jgi:hypothetical protein